MELYKKHRPKNFKDVLGQSAEVAVLENKVEKKKVPHAIMITGPSGTGKTTIGRILRRKLKCGKHDFTEINGADKGGIDDIRKIRERMGHAPINGKCRVWLIDEAHKITSAGQDMLLKMLEDTPRHVYFILATTDPQKLKRTIKTRCMEIKMKSLSDANLNSILKSICKKENIKIKPSVLKKIVGACDGSARQAVVFLDKIMDLEDEDLAIEAIEAATAEVEGIKVARALLNSSTSWKAMGAILKEVSSIDPETIRWSVLGYMNSVLLSGGKMSGRAFIVIDAFLDNFYDSKRTGLSHACYSVINGSD